MTDDYKVVIHESSTTVTAGIEPLGEYTLNSCKTLTMEEAEAVYRAFVGLYGSKSTGDNTAISGTYVAYDNSGRAVATSSVVMREQPSTLVKRSVEAKAARLEVEQ